MAAESMVGPTEEEGNIHSTSKTSSSIMGVPMESSVAGVPGGILLPPTQTTSTQGVGNGMIATSSSSSMATVSLRFPMERSHGSEDGLTSLAFLGNDDGYTFKMANAIDLDTINVSEFYSSSSSSASMASLVTSSSSSSSSPDIASWGQSSGKCMDDTDYSDPHNDPLPRKDPLPQSNDVMYRTAPSFFKTISNAIMKTMVDHVTIDQNARTDADEEKTVMRGLGMGLTFVATGEETVDDEEKDDDDDEDVDVDDDDDDDDAADLIKILSEDDHDEEQQEGSRGCGNHMWVEMTEDTLVKEETS